MSATGLTNLAKQASMPERPTQMDNATLILKQLFCDWMEHEEIECELKKINEKLDKLIAQQDFSAEDRAVLKATEQVHEAQSRIPKQE